MSIHDRQIAASQTTSKEAKAPHRMTRAVALCVAVLLSITFGGYALVRASLPPLDGTRVVSGLDAQVVIERDALGVPTLVGRIPTDLAYAMGFAHAQDRFFQMDLLRRVAAGELAALVGPSAIDTDRRHRLHRFRARAQLAAAALDSTSRHLLERYAAGVNDGLASLQSRPFEYWLLRSQPERWSVEDSLLVVYAMYFDLQYQELQRTLARAALHERVSMPLFAFLAPAASHWDAPLDQPPSATSSPPHSVNCALPPPTPDWLRATPLAPAALNRDAGSETAAMVGSNGWAVDAMHGADGHAILASDMHLGLSLPNIWYRVSVDMRDRLGSVSHRVTGVSLPGTPAIVAGSNGRIAWGFTNSYGNFIDLVELEVDPRDPSRFRMPDGHWTHASVHRESIAVRGAAPIEMDVADSPWGPLITVGAHRYAVHWIAHEAGAVDFGLEKLADADDVPGALTMGAESGIPSQNLIVVDNQGHIGWTIAGPLPRRPQTDLATMPDLPVRSDVYPGWDGFLSPAEHPRMIDPTSGRLWAANNRQLIGAEQMKIGDSGSDVGARATQIRDTLLAHERMSERDMLALQTDDRALWIEPWRRLALDALDDAAIEARPQRAQYRRLVEQWNGRADVDAVGYTLLRAFYTALYDAWFGKLDAELAQVHPGLGYRVATSRSLAVMETLTRCHAWVPPGFIDWHAFILERIDRAIGALTQDGMPLQAARWGEHNRAAIAHPFAHTMAAHVPLLDSLLSAPNEPLPGDKHMPRVQAPSFGASERMVVSAGHEAQAILTMPGGQSGNPASPYFLAGHDHWVHGDASPLLPGPSVHRLQLIPEKRP